MTTHCNCNGNLIPSGNDFYLAVTLKSRSLVDGEVVETPFDFEAADTYNARIYGILDGTTLSTMVGLKDGTTDTVIIDAKGVPLIRAIGVEVTGEVDGRAFRAAEKGFISIVEFNGEARVVFTPVTGGQEANLVMTLTFLPSAAVVGKNAYEIWKEEPGNQDKTLADFIYFLGHGESAYEIAVRYGYTGTEAEYNMLYFDAVDVANTAGQNAQQAADTANEMAAQAQDAAELADAATTNANNAATAAAATVDAAIDNMEDTLNAAIAAQDAEIASKEAEIDAEFATQTALINQKQLEIGAVPSDLTPTAGSTNWVTSGGVWGVTNALKIYKEEDISGLFISKTGRIYSNKWKDPTDNNYKFILINVTLLRGKRIVLEPQESSSPRFAYTKNAFSNNSSVQYATGSSLAIITVKNDTIVPDDAVYLYVTKIVSGNNTPCKVTIYETVHENIGKLNANELTIMRNTLANGGFYTFDNTNAEQLEIYSRDTLYRAQSTSLGQTPSSVSAATDSAKISYKVPVDGIAYVDLYSFASSGGYGHVFIDNDNLIVHYCGSTSEEKIRCYVPSTAKYLIYCAIPDATEITLYPQEQILPSIQLEKVKLNEKYVYSDDYKILKANVTIGTHINNAISTTTSSGWKIFRINIAGAKTICYNMFATTSGYGSVITDIDGSIIWEKEYVGGVTGAKRYVDVPFNAYYFYYCISPTLGALDYEFGIDYIIKDYVDEKSNYKAVPRLLPTDSTLTNDSDYSLCLAAIKFKLQNDAIPFQQGYLFHKLGITDNKIYYGTKLDNAEEVATLDYYPRNCVLAVSPKDGTVIGVTRDIRANIRVYHNEQNYTVAAVSSDGQNASPQGWLYNSGVDFVKDGNNEYCIFAEYDGSVSDGHRLYIWKGTYPYTSASDWKTTFYKVTSYNSGNPTAGSITHWHMIRRDPWTGILYCTSGDFTGQFMWLYSSDNGETWTEFASDYDNSTKPSWVGDGQPLRCINFIFTAKYIYFATDHGSSNTLCRIQRGVSGVIDTTTREVIADLPYGIAVNTLCYVENPNGLFMFTRIDTGFNSEYSEQVPILFWDFKTETLQTLAKLKQTSATWGGHRGKCYFNYTNGIEPRPAMGFADNTRCQFDLIGATNNTGTIFYELI